MILSPSISLVLLCMIITSHSFSVHKVKTFNIVRESKNYHIKTTKLFSDGKRKITDSSQYLGIKDRKWLIGSKPNNSLLLALSNFKKEVFQIFESIRLDTIGKADKESSLPDVLNLHLSNEAVKAVEELRESKEGRVDSHPIARVLYDVGCYFLDRFFVNRPIECFWCLETVARTPYFAYVSVLHFYESMGWLRAASLRKVHNAQEWNELHHLLIMESLGGDRNWKDRFLGYHAAVLYYWLLVVTYFFSPAAAYEFTALLETHAVDTYGAFLSENKEALQNLPAPAVAVAYYSGSDLYEFDEFQVSRQPGTRRPVCETLYDVFNNIRDDECEHVNTMQACQLYAEEGTVVESPHEKFRESTKIELSDEINKEKVPSRVEVPRTEK